MDFPGPAFLNRDLFGAVSNGEALLAFVALIVLVSIINRIQRARMLNR